MLKIEHAEGTPEESTQPGIEPFHTAVAGTIHEVIGDLIQPVLQGLTEGRQRLQAQVPGLLHPRPQLLGPGRCRADRRILEELTQPVPLLPQLLEQREPCPGAANSTRSSTLRFSALVNHSQSFAAKLGGRTACPVDRWPRGLACRPLPPARAGSPRGLPPEAPTNPDLCDIMPPWSHVSCPHAG